MKKNNMIKISQLIINLNRLELDCEALDLFKESLEKKNSLELD